MATELSLVFFWIDDYRGLKNANINFGSEWFFSVSEVVEGCFEIKKERNDNYIPCFFSNDQDKSISNISAIVGENGSGKSNIINAIRLAFGGNATFKYVLLFSSGGKYYYKSSGLVIPLEYKKLSETKMPELIHYSPIFDLSNLSSGYAEFGCDVSTNYLLRDDIRRVGMRLFRNNQLLTFKTQDTLRQLNFVQSIGVPLREQIEEIIVLPTKVVSVLLHNPSPVAQKGTPPSLRNIMGRIENTFDASIGELKRSEKKQESDCLLTKERFLFEKKRFLSKSLKIFFYEFFQCFCIDESSDPPIDPPIDHLQYKDIDDGEELFVFLLKELMKRSGYSSLAGTMFNLCELYKEVVNSIKYEDVLIEQTKGGRKNKSPFKTGDDGNTTIVISLKAAEKLIDKYCEFIGALAEYNHEKSYTNSNHDEYNGFLEFDWHELSSGEKAYLNLFSRFHYAREQLLSPSNEKGFKDNVLILIDEGELGFHLEWQRGYVEKLIEYFTKAFASKDRSGNTFDPNVQIIFTTHSPFSLSDIPSYNIVYLKPKINTETKNKECVVLSPRESPHTSFAANVHSLMIHSFFLEKGLSGEFAVKKINSAIESLLSENHLDENLLKSIEKLIEIIDEPIIKGQLQMLLNRKKENND